MSKDGFSLKLQTKDLVELLEKLSVKFGWV